MGSGRFTSEDWVSYATTSSYSTKSTEEIFSKSNLDSELDPKGVVLRESRDSADNPASNAIILALDVTGSMGMIADTMARNGLPTLMTNIYDRKPVTDPHIMCMGIGDAEAGDRAPLQVTQFEADIRISKQLEKVYLEHGGGGNSYESYALAWYFAAQHTSIDCFEKRDKKGYLFTIGDELPTPYLRKQDIERVCGDTIQSSKLEIKDILTLASRSWNIFHIVVEEGNYALGNPKVHSAWVDVLGQRALKLSDHTKLAELIVSTIQIAEGHDAEAVAKSWDGKTELVIRKATKGLTPVNTTSSGGVVSL